MDVWDSVARNLATVGDFDRPQFDGKKAQARFAILLRDHRDDNRASMRASGVAEEVTEKTILLDDLATQVDEAKNEEMRRASTEDSTAARSEEAGALVRDEAMKSQGKRKAEDGDGESNASGNRSELDLRKFMFARELEERKKDREHEVEERQRNFEERKMDRQREVNERQKDREVQMQQMQVMQSAMTTVLDALVKKL
ncbi:hypothetical protein AaE_013864 [Aphanomyces astaci]|uniref:Uncharacterized protein n=1 Tax=Aphanomyces astaci TaxID=112090 RepID=A0A6A4Z5S8_APHAT|nr:hypothetical protein AaE_013864 [Aphanomyces astaci]